MAVRFAVDVVPMVGNTEQHLGEHTILLRYGGNRRQLGCGIVRPCALPSEEKEGVVLDDGSAKGGAVLILYELRFGGVGGLKIRIGVEEGIAQELEEAAVKLIGSRLGGDVHHGARGFPKLRRKGARLDLEFLH